jgi:hypothetical protein
MLKLLPAPGHGVPYLPGVLLGTIAVKLMALPGVMYSMNPLPQPLVDPAWSPKFNVSAAAGWVVVSVVVEFALPAIDPEPRSGPVMPPWRQNQEPEQEAFVHVRVRVTVPSAFDAWTGTTAGADTEAAMRTMRTPKVRIPSLRGANRREIVEFICRFSFHSVVRHVLTRPA